MWHWRFEVVAVNDPVYISAGRYKHRSGYVISKSDTQARVILSDTGREVNVIYPNVQEVDGQGQPKESPIFDMTGREMKVGDMLACAGKKGMEICRIVGGNHLDGITIQTVIRQGVKLPPDKWSLNQRTMGNPPMNALKLPVDDATFVMWKLRDYELTRTLA